MCGNEVGDTKIGVRLFVCALLPGFDFDPVFILRKQAINSIRHDKRKPTLKTHRNKRTQLYKVGSTTTPDKGSALMIFEQFRL